MTARMDDRVVKAEELLKLWNRVCGEVDDGKPWSEIDNGMRPEAQGDNMPPSVWKAYMLARMRHLLNDIVIEYRRAAH